MEEKACNGRVHGKDGDDNGGVCKGKDFRFTENNLRSGSQRYVLGPLLYTVKRRSLMHYEMKDPLPTSIVMEISLTTT
jgi:hypothetical protein